MTGHILIVTLNSCHLTRQAVNSALGQDIECTVLAIDNGSTDNTVPWLRTKPVAVSVNQQRMPLAWCWNQGLKKFWKMGAVDALVLNNDLRLRSDYYRLLRAMDKPFVSGVGVSREEQVGTAGDRLTADLRAGARPRPDFSAFLIRREVTNKVGWFDEECSPAFYEDNFYHVAMWEWGIEAVCVDLPFLHHGSQTIKNVDEGERARIQRGAEASRRRFMKMYGCAPGTEAYNLLFTEARFGMKKRVTPMT